ncbi:hypothetical protein N6L24_08305 [Cognatishimia sp. SS12]|uniref:autotransporter outer membrane beta-barrel domain-containing protein n=1 Tax=Cognatishimia sp. SS12 TaxID=2979465 RepID=UPI00232FC538|nr:hypothetical protein [Cognatishimia sp. SS12]MDC0738280.1 hypothetical protein [Cognatishimia sp. SS12]
MSRSNRAQALSTHGGRMTKWKGRVASMAPSLFLGTVSVTALMLGEAQAETIDTVETTPRYSAVDEDHTVTSSGAVAVTTLGDDAIVEIDVAAFTSTLTNAGSITADNVGGTTHAGALLTGDLSGALSNEGTIDINSSGNSSATLVGIDLQAVSGRVSNSGTIAVNATARSYAAATGIRMTTATGDMLNSGSLSVTANSDFSSASAAGFMVNTLSGTVSNTGVIDVAATGQNWIWAAGGLVLGVSSGAQVDNSGTMTVSASAASSSAQVLGLGAFALQGTLSNAGTLEVEATGNSALASGIWALGVDTDGIASNSGTVLVSAVSQGSENAAYATGMLTYQMQGEMRNSGTLDVNASGDFASATGIEAGGEGSELADMSGAFSNTGTIAINARGDSWASGYGMYLYDLSGTASNSGTIDVTSTAQSGGRATGIAVENLGATGSVTNSGTITVAGNFADPTYFYGAGIGVDTLAGTVTNSGVITVSSNTTGASAGDGADLAGIGVFDLSGTLTHSGTIAVSGASGSGTAAYGIYADVFSGTVNLTGDVAASGSETTYALYLGAGGGALNVETSAIVQGLIYVDDADVTLTHMGHARVYAFEDADPGAGGFATVLSGDNQAWFSDGAGGGTPVYASAMGEDFAANRLLPFELGALSDGLKAELGLGGGTAGVSRNSTEAGTPHMPVSSFVRLGYRHARSPGAAGTARSDLGSLTAGLTDVVGDTRWGMALALAEGNSTQVNNRQRTEGGFISTLVARDFGWADLSFGFGAGRFSHENRRSIGGSSDAIGSFGSVVQMAQLGISRDVALSERLTLTPRAGLRHGVQKIDGYTETGSSANATVAARDVSFTEVTLGANWAAELPKGTLNLSLDAVHRDISSPSLMDVSIFGSSAALTTGGSESQRFGVIGLSYETAIGKGGMLTLAANGQFGNGQKGQSVSAKYEWTF